MAPPKRPWFRFYVETFADVELRVLPPAQRWVWGALMAIARTSSVPGALLDKSGEPVTDAYIAEFAAVKVSDVRAAMERFRTIGSIRDDGSTVVLTNWDTRQFESDDVATRVAKHRASNGPSGADVTANTPPHETTFAHGTEVQSSEVVVTSSGEPTLVRASTALSLLTKAKHASHGGEVDGHVTALTASHGPDAVERAVQTVVDQLAGKSFAWPSDVRKALEAELGPAPAEAKPNPLDEAQRAQHQQIEGGLDLVRSVLAEAEQDAEKRRALVAARRAEREARRSA